METRFGNRRKVRGGQSLENHFQFLLEEYRISFSRSEKSQTDGKVPDFMCPSMAAYDSGSPVESLVYVALKQTTRDRWPQILEEAPRCKATTTYLLTVDEDIHEPQMDLMEAKHVQLVIPKPRQMLYPAEVRRRFLSLAQLLAVILHRTRSGAEV